MVNTLENRMEENSDTEKIEKYTQEELESFVDGIRRAAVKIRELDPGYYVVSLNGGLALFDILNIIDVDVDPNRAVYFPGSSRIKRSRDVLRNCFENFFLEKQDETNEWCSLVSLDEVVGGHSVERVINAYNAASRRVARFHNLRGAERRREDIDAIAYELRELFPLTILGIRDMRKTRRRLNQRYLRLSDPENENRMIFEFPVKRIITMDDPDYDTVKFAHPKSSGWSGRDYYPKVEWTGEKTLYRDLLRDVARYVGVDPETVDPIRARVDTDCEKYSKKPKYN